MTVIKERDTKKKRKNGESKILDMGAYNYARIKDTIETSFATDQ